MNGEFKSFFKTAGANEGSKCHYPTRLDTYGCGCGHNCKYCYAREIMTAYGRWHPDNPLMATLQKIEHRLQMLNSGCILRLGGLTDCFQPIELKQHLTFETIKLLNKYRIGYLLVTKSHHVADDEYMAIYDRELAHIQISITTLDDKLAATYESASTPTQRVEAIEKLHAAGFDTHIRLSPYINGYIDWRRFNAIKCDKVLVEFLRASGPIKHVFPIDYSLYTVKQNVYWQMPLEEKLKVLKEIKGKTVSVCEDNTEHYKWWRDNFNPNPYDCCNLRHSNDGRCPPMVKSIKRGKKWSFDIVFADGCKIEGRNARDVFVKALEHCGLERIIAADFHYSGEPLVSKTRHRKYSMQSKLSADGYYIQTHSSTQSKVKTLERIFAAIGVCANIIVHDDRVFI